LNKKGGSLAGCWFCIFYFCKKRLFCHRKIQSDRDQLIEIALDLGTDDPLTEGDSFELTCDPSLFEVVKNALAAKNIENNNS